LILGGNTRDGFAECGDASIRSICQHDADDETDCGTFFEQAAGKRVESRPQVKPVNSRDGYERKNERNDAFHR
jgi:hypothetical protein